jgi:hydrogenase expression/formation protein HypE
MEPFGLGKLPSEELNRLFSRLRRDHPRLLLGPGIGLDCAVIDFGETLLVAKSDPITFTGEDIGWYSVQVNANDIATTGAQPKWFLATLLLPEEDTERDMVDEIFVQMEDACKELDVLIIGGHTEITVGLDRPIISGTMLGEVQRDNLVTPKGACPGDALLISKGVPIEAGSILAREYTASLANLGEGTLDRARNYLKQPGISVVKEALAAAENGCATAMHDPTEGGVLSALWELSEAASVGLMVELDAIPILPEAEAICQRLNVDPLSAIASGSLLITVKKPSLNIVVEAIERLGIPISLIGWLTEEIGVFNQEDLKPLPKPKRDALAELFERLPPDA